MMPRNAINPGCKTIHVSTLTAALFFSLALLFSPGPVSSQGKSMGGMGAMKKKDAMPGMRQGMGGMSPAPAWVPRFPPVKGYSEGRVIYFIHTEASDGGIANMLTEMMGGSPVLAVPSLAKAPDAMVANLYAFKNGLKKGDGPFGYTADVFENPPGLDGYSPLRRIHLVFWEDSATPRELKSAGEVLAAQAAGEIRIEKTGIVVNMPMLTWPGGKR